MSLFLDFLAYSLEIEWLLTWFPVGDGADLSAPKVRGGIIRHRNTDADLGSGHFVSHLLGGDGGVDDPLTPVDVVNAVAGFIDVGVRSSDLVFEATFKLDVGRVTRSKRLTLEPGRVVPFLINVHAAQDADIVHDTAAALQGVITTGHRLTVTDVISRVVGP